MDLNELRDKAYDIACRHGWHEEELSDEHFLMLIISEFAEAIDSDRIGKFAKVDEFKWFEANALLEDHLNEEELESALTIEFCTDIKDTVEDELADVVIRCLDLAGLKRFDFSEVTDNEIEEYHGMAYTMNTDKADYPLTDFAYDCVRDLTAPDTDLLEKLALTIVNVKCYCETHGVSLEWHVKHKMEYNELRPYKHNKKY